MQKILKHISNRGILLIVFFSLLDTSCKLNEKYSSPEFTHDDLYRGVDGKDTTSLAQIPWEQVFTDTLLQQLIREGLENNLDLEIAMARMESAKANLTSAWGALLPNLSAYFSYSRKYGSSTTYSAASGFATTQYNLYGLANWEIDFWGKYRSARRSAMASLLQSEAYRRAVETQLIASIATYYYTLLAYDKQLEITQLTVKFREEYEVTVEQLKEAATVTGADLMQSRANLYSAHVMIPDLKRSIRETENALSILINRSPGPIERSALEEQHTGELLETGVPLLLLANRPDVQQAEFGLRSAFEMVNSARAYFYPSVTLQGYVPGSVASSSRISELFDPSNFYKRIVGAVTQPIFNQNQNIARLKANQAAQQEALATYRKTILTAGQEVSNALFAYGMAEEKITIRKNQLEALQNAVDYNQELLKFSSNSYVDVLTSQQNLLTGQLSGVDDQLQKLSSLVELYRALGGGWDELPESDPVAQKWSKKEIKREMKQAKADAKAAKRAEKANKAEK